MGVATKIEWTDYTWSPWHGCAKVSPGCANCYAEKLSHRNPAVLGEWGPAGKRAIKSESGWKAPLTWDRAAAKAGERRRVFPSLCDPFEDRPELVAPRVRLFHLINETPNLDWLLLTKRPENIHRLWAEAMPSNCWLGVSVEDQKRADERIPELLKIPAAVRFLSVEPLLSRVDLNLNGISWVICGGESSHGARPVHPDWVRSIRDQCQAAGVPFFFKQWGEWAPIGPFHYDPAIGSGNREYVRALDAFAREHEASRLIDDRPEGWDRQMIEDGTCVLNGEMAIGRIGKKASGRMLDGREWNEFPELRPLFPRGD